MHLFFLDSFHWSQLLQPQWYIQHGGLWLLLLVVFAETGLFIGFFFPGDSLLFVAGIFAHEMPLNKNTSQPGLAHQFLNLIGLGNFQVPIIDLLVLCALISVAGILGNTVGYITGKKIGPSMFNWRDRFLFKTKYLFEAQEFYNKHGNLAIIGARFVPFIRTFAPIVAGIVEMDKKKFHFLNIVGCIAWVCTMIFSGFYLQKWMMNLFNFDLKEHLEIIVLAIVLITTAPVLLNVFFKKKK